MIGSIIAGAITVAVVTCFITKLYLSAQFDDLLLARNDREKNRVERLHSKLFSMEVKISSLADDNNTAKRAFHKVDTELKEAKKELAELKASSSKKSKDDESLISKLQSKLDDLAGDTASLMDEAVEAAQDIVEDVVEEATEVIKKVMPKKKRKYTRKRKPAAKK